MSIENNFVLNWGIVGTGLIANDFSTSLQTLKSDLHVLKAVAALSLNEANTFGDKFNIKNRYYENTLDEIYSDKDVNIIYVATINKTHRDICLKAINAGKHVLCEKPMCLNRKEQEEIFVAAKEKNVFFMEALWIRFTPAMDAIRKELEKKAFGELKFFVANLMHDYMHIERLKNKENGGGVVLDMGIYMVQLACLVFNHEKPIKIVATGGLMPTGVDEFESISMIYEGNRMATLNVSVNCGREDSSVLVGPKGWLRITNLLTSACKLEYSTGDQIIVQPPENGEFKFNFFNRICLRYQAEECRQAISKGLLEHPKATHDNCRLILSIMDEVRKQFGYTFENE